MATENLGSGHWQADNGPPQCSYSGAQKDGPAIYLSAESGSATETAEEVGKLDNSEELQTGEGPGRWEPITGIGSGAQRRDLGNEIVIHFVVTGRVYDLSGEKETNPNMTQLDRSARVIAREIASAPSAKATVSSPAPGKSSLPRVPAGLDSVGDISPENSSGLGEGTVIPSGVTVPCGGGHGSPGEQISSTAGSELYGELCDAADTTLREWSEHANLEGSASGHLVANEAHTEAPFHCAEKDEVVGCKIEYSVLQGSGEEAVEKPASYIVSFRASDGRSPLGH